MKISNRYKRNMARVLGGLASVTALLALCACADGAGKMPEEVKRVVKAAESGKATDFAGVCDYPVERPYPLKDIEDSTSMVKYYDVLVDDSLRKVLTHSSRADWDDYGWRGWSVRDGRYVWIDGKIYNIPYVSLAERKMIRKLMDEEKNTWPPHMRRGWHPAACLRSETDGKVFRIDAADSEMAPVDSLYRMSVYESDSVLTAEPSEVMTGKMDIEGSAGIRMFYFRDRNGNSMEYTPDDSGEGESDNLVWKPVKGKPRSYMVRKVYWRDLLPDSIKHSSRR